MEITPGVECFFAREPVRLYIDLKQARKKQGASTLTMQRARSLWLEPAKSWSRKLQEPIITMHLERKLSLHEIFEHHSNEVYLGQRGTLQSVALPRARPRKAQSRASR